MYAKTSRAPRETLWQTWCEAAKWFGLPELPLTYELVLACATFFKAGKYRSATLYFSRARQEHIEWTRTEVPPNVLLAMSKAIRSIERGMGVTVLKECFLMEDVLKIDEFRTKIPNTVASDAVYPAFLVLLGTWYQRPKETLKR